LRPNGRQTEGMHAHADSRRTAPHLTSLSLFFAYVPKVRSVPTTCTTCHVCLCTVAVALPKLSLHCDLLQPRVCCRAEGGGAAEEEELASGGQDLWHSRRQEGRSLPSQTSQAGSSRRRYRTLTPPQPTADRPLRTATSAATCTATCTATAIADATDTRTAGDHTLTSTDTLTAGCRALTSTDTHTLRV